MSQITVHVLDTALGKPAQGINVQLSAWRAGQWQLVAQGVTNADGRVVGLLPSEQVLEAGRYQMHFELEAYLAQTAQPLFYPYADIVFQIGGDGQHYHIPLLLSPFGYSTYRGS
ncbi:hydroxyisourate hydrolase [Thiofilum flexile]|uniref:hydroxyisourate hydrolase n=1 Tax=Thiofilum flexile TaxID=125627 RepID=UPI00037F456C|nr:hydroxyisourate hydrolase [Thiofilum flexile]